MGIIIAKFRKKKSTYDILEELEQEITSIEEFGRSTEQTRKKIVSRFVLLAIFVYLILAFVLYIYYHKISVNQRLICIIPSIAFPLIIWFIKRVLTWYYSRKIIKNQKKLVSLKQEKNKILDNVMETETYKVAKKILDKFGNDSLRKPPAIISLSESTPVTKKSSAITPSLPSTLRPNETGTGIRQRNIAPPSGVRGRIPLAGSQTPFRDRPLTQVQSAITPRSVARLAMLPSAGSIPGSTPLPLPRNILPRERSVLDKMVDYLVGDGPSNRYALICKKCNSHNGMALKEEFEYLSFRCCYCSAFNPALKIKPSGPKFDSDVSPKKALPMLEATIDSSDSDKDTESNVDKHEIIPESGKDSLVIEQTLNTEKSLELDLESSDTEVPLNRIVEPDNDENLLDIPMEIGGIGDMEDTQMEVSELADTVETASGETFSQEENKEVQAELVNQTPKEKD